MDFKNIRDIRQKINNLTVYNSILHNEVETFYNNINIKELERTLEDLNISFEEFWNKSRQDDIFRNFIVRFLSKKSFRQCIKDELEQLRICNITAQLCGIKIRKLSSSEFIPVKDGRIVSRLNLNLPKDYCLKSFDGIISGKMRGYIIAKVSYGQGGHQDNVFEELDAVANWWSIYKKDSDEHLIILIDTDLVNKFECICNKYKTRSNVNIFNNYTFQEYMIERFYDDEMK